MATVLAISAHPDDELFGAGYLAKLTSEGNELYILCTTRGEGGEVGEPPVGPKSRLGEFREVEMQGSGRALGAREVWFLDFVDPWMEIGGEALAIDADPATFVARVVGSEAPEAVMPNLTAEQLRAFQERVTLVDMIDITDAEAVIVRATELGKSTPAATTDNRPTILAEDPDVEQIIATRDPVDAWVYDPAGYFLVFVDRMRAVLRVEQYTPEHRRVRIIEGATAEEISHTVVRLGQVTILAHAAYLGRELAKAETALKLGLEYDQDRPLLRPAVHDGTEADEEMEERLGDGTGNRRAP